jgi:putative glutamine amidotransferase
VPSRIIEAIELPEHPFAIGVQWHQELFAGQDHPGNKLFEAFVRAAKERRPSPNAVRAVE